MTPTKGNGTGATKLTVAVLAVAISAAGAGYAIMAGRMDDKCETLSQGIRGVSSIVDRNTYRIDSVERTEVEMRERLARIETKVDRLLERER